MGQSNMVGIRQVAQRSRVSTATVARVLRGSSQVSPELTRRVLSAIDELGYVPNAVARSLAQGRTHLLGLVIPDISNPFFSELARGLEDRAVQAGYHVLVASSDLKPGRENELLLAFESRTVDAVVITPTTATPEGMQSLVNRGIPVVFVDRHFPDVPAPAVLSDNKQAVQRAVEYLFALGHREVAIISGPGHFETAAARVDGYRAAFRVHRRRPRAVHVREGFLGVDGGRRAMAELLTVEPRPTAVLSFNNLLAVGALYALREAGLRVPEDMSVITFDDMLLFPLVDPPVTAIAQPAYQMGATAATLVLGLLEGRRTTSSEVVVLPTEFRERGSCAPPTGNVAHARARTPATPRGADSR